MIVGSCAGSLYALARRSGAPVWQYDTKADAAHAQFHGEPLVAGSRLVIPTDDDPRGALYSLDITSGDLLWKILLERGAATTPLLVGRRIVALSARGEVLAVDPADGKIAWRASPAGTLKPIPFIVSPAFASKRIFVADNTGKVFALDASTGATVWHQNLAARATTALVVVGTTLVVGTADGTVNWISTRSGEVKRRLRLEEGRPYGTPILAPPMLFILATGKSGTLLALDAATGALRWKQETPEEWTTYRPLVAGTSVIVGSTEKNLCAFDRMSGERRWCRSIGEVPRGLGIGGDGTLYVGSLSGVVQALRAPEGEAQ